MFRRSIPLRSLPKYCNTKFVSELLTLLEDSPFRKIKNFDTISDTMMVLLRSDFVWNAASVLDKWEYNCHFYPSSEAYSEP